VEVTVRDAQERRQRRTNVRYSPGERALRAAFPPLAQLAPELAASLADRLFFTPPRHRRSPRIDNFLATGCRADVRVAETVVATWRWGAGPAVLLVHGWGGVGGQLRAFTQPLLDRGFSVVAFDAPGHGRSGGRRSSLVDFARALGAVADSVGRVHAVIAHSLGGAATAFALRDGLAARRTVLVGAPADPTAWTRAFERRLSIPEPVMERMRARVEERLGVRWSDLHVLSLARSLATPLLLVHDRDDEEVPWADGAALAAAWPGARLMTTAGLGHRRILREPSVIDAAVGFVAEGADGAWDAAARLESEMFDRDLRWRRRAAPLLAPARLPA
jgi:pimeloyl-ACP methyl ester carboxylesterase